MGTIVGPNDNLAPISFRESVSLYACIRTDVSSLRILNLRIRAVKISADQRRSTSGSAANIHECIVKQSHVVSQNLHRAAFPACTLASRADGAGIDHRGRTLCVMTTIYDHGAAGAGGATSGEGARVLNVAAAGAQVDVPAFVSNRVSAHNAAVVNRQGINISASRF